MENTIENAQKGSPSQSLTNDTKHKQNTMDSTKEKQVAPPSKIKNINIPKGYYPSPHRTWHHTGSHEAYLSRYAQAIPIRNQSP